MVQGRASLAALVAALSGCVEADEASYVVRPDAQDGAVPVDVQPALTFASWWERPARTGLDLERVPDGTTVRTEAVGFDNGLVFRPVAPLEDGGAYQVGDTSFVVSAAASSLRPEDGDWPATVVRAETNGFRVRLWFEADPMPPWFDVLVRVSETCELELIGLRGEVEVGAPACGLEEMPATITVSQRAVDWNGDASRDFSKPRVVVLSGAVPL